MPRGPGQVSARHWNRALLIGGILVVGALAGAAFGLYVEYSNWQKGNPWWENKPQGFADSGPGLSQVVFGTLPVGILIGYIAFGFFVAAAVVTFVITRRAYIRTRRR